MGNDSSFDITSKINMPELENAINQATMEIRQRFDFRGSKSEIVKEEDTLVLTSEEEFKIKNMNDILQNKFIKRGISLKFIEYGKIEPAAGGTVKQVNKLKQGIPQDKAKEIVGMIKDMKIKVQASIQADQIRVTAKSKDDLQLVIQMLRKANMPIELQFVNYR